MSMHIMSTIVTMWRSSILAAKTASEFDQLGKGAKISPRLVVTYEIVERRGLWPID
jgi:hypothetical protein